MSSNKEILRENLKFLCPDDIDDHEVFESFKLVPVTDLENPPTVAHPSCILTECLCSKTGLKYHYIIEQKETERTCWVGSSCIKRFLPHLDSVVKRAKIIYEGGVCCNRCSKKLPEGTVFKLLSLHIPVDEMLHHNCWKKNRDNIRINRIISPPIADDDPIIFGKYKGQPHSILKNVESYSNWLVGCENVVCRYPRTIAYINTYIL